jgi:diguanylate cyclase (GGDEF)-like protein
MGPSDVNAFENVPLRRPADRILIVDDDPVVGDVLVTAVELLGYRADLRKSGEEALQALHELRRPIVITDMRMPGMDGLTLLNRLRQWNLDTDVIVITGHGSIENAVECMKAGAVDYLIKPFSVEQIQVAVQKAFERRDLKEKAKKGEFYRKLAYVDALTAVFNRRHFDEAIVAEIERASLKGTRVLLMMVDIDDFKTFNDRHGHQNGDAALKRLAALLMASCRASDIVARYGGEEFTVIFPGTDRSMAQLLADRILEAVRNENFKWDSDMAAESVTVSIGAACYPDDALDADGLVRRADEALYAAKRAGKNRFVLWKP